MVIGGVSLVISILSVILTLIIAKSPKKRRKVFIAAVLPFISLYTFYILGIVGMSIVAHKYNVDPGFGDSWYAPINDECRILMIDITDQGVIECNDSHQTEPISHIQEHEDFLIGEKLDGRYLTYSIESKEVAHFNSKEELLSTTNLNKLNLIPIDDYYWELKSRISNTLYIVVVISILMIVIITNVIFSRLVLFGWYLGFKSKYNNPTD